MELRAFAERCLNSVEMAEKLSPPGAAFTDREPGPSVRVERPGRPGNLQFAARRTAPALPKPASLKDPAKRGLAHHILANHELQALEVMAWTLLAFPSAPTEFRLGVGAIMLDEQRHTRLHIERARRLGVSFGDFPVNSYIWSKAMELTSPLEYCACLPLVFEARNLDHSLELAEQFAAVGDDRSAAALRTIHQDEIGHVAFGWEWLRKLKPPGAADFEAFESSLHWPLRPAKARGDVFQIAARAAAGLSPEFIAKLAAAEPED